MKLRLILSMLAVVACAPACSKEPGPSATSDARDDISARYRAWIDSPGGELPFGLTIEADPGGAADSGYRATVHNGSESIEIPICTFVDGELRLEFPHYDSRISATLTDTGDLAGNWNRRRSGADEWSDMPFHAARGVEARFPELENGPSTAAAVAGRWRVDFTSSDDPAVAIFEESQGKLLGTILTTTGDYRYLAGAAQGDRIAFSCFDGAHAFLFHASRGDDGSLSGDFWSSHSWHETWTAVSDADVELPDPYQQTSWVDGARLDDVSFPDLDGTPRSLVDPEFAGKARVLQIFGSWCPNCHDASHYMAELHREYRERGLSVLGLAFELTGDHARDAEQVRHYIARHRIDYPVLIAGVADKKKATDSLGLLDRVRSYPTTVFLRADGSVHSIHTGFTGPATGEAYNDVRREFRSIIEELLGMRSGGADAQAPGD